MLRGVKKHPSIVALARTLKTPALTMSWRLLVGDVGSDSPCGGRDDALL
jgi:hypothetical protein